ncbi:MAG: hypothetical protein ACI9LG_002228 [Moritella dasanensis]|jgi:hypothetical protein
MKKMPITMTVMGIFVFALTRHQAFIKEQCLEMTMHFDCRYHLG